MNTQGVPHRPAPRSETGSAIILVVLLLSILAFVPIAIHLSQISYQNTKLQLSTTTQADNVARAGLIDAISWFRRQASQPVDQGGFTYADAGFYPRENPDPMLADTENETIGLVKEYELTDNTNLWARYEVKRQSDTAIYPFDSHAVHDVSDKRIDGATAGSGLAWSIESIGYVYRRKDASVPYDTAPNEIIAKSRVSTEIRRISITLPANCAVIVSTANTVTLQSNSKIVGGNNIGLGYFSGTNPTVSGSSITGSPAQANITTASSTAISPLAIFGVTLNEFKLMSDISCSTFSELSSTYPSMAIVYINGNAAFSSSKQLRGGGILYVKGNLTLPANANTFFSGLVFVEGNVTITGAHNIAGALVVTGSLTMNGAGDVPLVEYDAGILSSVRQQVAQYRENKATFYTFSGLKRD